MKIETLNMPPNSIVSLVPSLTELLFDLGLGEKVTGRTKFCIHPREKIDRVQIVGGTKNPRLDKIREIQPELVIVNKEENRREDVEELKRYFDVHVTEIGNINEALFTIHDIGWKCGVEEKAKSMIHKIQEKMEDVPEEKPMTAAYMIWRDPWMTVGGDTYIHSVMDHCNLENVFSDKTRYPNTSLEELSLKNPDVILLSSEPYPFKEKHIREVNEYCKKTSIILVNGEWFSWYGSRMLKAFEKLNVLRRAIA
ncbi:helical backbone metal receptor [Rhodohalobacter sulfatireducens]|uniref:Helical backbone metal receptor n=1 Tax=Rhodohalobacter sulfatireducens TaxID=2911366 RepID=A0ABS9KIC7_9BACT|nr:helical backbone metal receptor [Rhodohalobacter sulfatireducens]MCG2590613.1 helical backbone metal receptor [Rhodohalobacter sulfatireducens]